MPTLSREQRQALREAIASLPEPTRSVYLADLLHGIDYRAIGALQGLSVREVERHIADAILLIDRQLRSDRRWSR